MRFRKSRIYILTLLALMLMVAGCNPDSSKSTENNNDTTGNSNGELRVAVAGQPPTLDQHISVVSSTADVARPIFETLMTLNSNYQAVPMLAESIDVSEDNKTYTFHLREGVKFHNGKEMTAADAVASMSRWTAKTSVAGTLFEGATFEPQGDYTVVLVLAQPSVLVLDTLASPINPAAIMPKEVIEAATAEGVSEYIGTGPFKFVEWKQDQHIHITKYENYQSLEEEADGFAGKKEALVDDIYFEIVTDASTRLAGLQTGKYDYAYSIPYDNYEQLKKDRNLTPVLDNTSSINLYYNEKKGLSTDFKMRQAINTALDLEEVMLASVGNEELYSVQSGYMHNSRTNWASDAGSEFYNQNDPEKAKKILKEIGYDNEEFRILTTRDYPHFYNAAVNVHEQLTKLGMNVKLDVYDNAAATARIENLEEWDGLLTAAISAIIPTQLLSISTTFAGGINDPTTAKLVESMETTPSLDKAKESWDELQGYVLESHIPVTVLVNYNTFGGMTNKVEGLKTLSGPIFWNTSVVK